MKKYSYFQCSAHLSQLQARLDKNGYLSKGSLPNSADAKVFLLFERLRKIPKHATHPNLYHWYILMKQFSLRTVQIWEQQLAGSQNDKFINEYIMREINSLEKENTITLNNSSPQPTNTHKHLKTLPFLLTPKSCSKRLKNQEFNQIPATRPNMLPTSLKLIPFESGYSKGELGSPAFQKQYVMEMQLKQSSRRIYGLKQRLQQQRLQLISLQVEQKSIRVVFRAEPDQYQKLKDRISQWEEISNLRFRKQKRFNNKSENKSERIIANNDVGVALAN